MKLSRLFLFLFATFFHFLANAQPCREVVAYFPSWKWYDRNHLVNPSTIDYSKYTVINYAFFQPNFDGCVSPFDPALDKMLLLGEMRENAPSGYPRRDDFGNPAWHCAETSLVEKAHRHGVKVTISIGGWTLSDKFPAICASHEKRVRFAQSCLQMVEVYGIDGIDIDWEYPGYREHNGSSADKRNFTFLLEEIRFGFDEFTRQTGKPLLLSAAFGVSAHRLAQIEWAKVSPLLDHVNLMTYDFYGVGHASTNHHAPLFDPAKGIKDFSLHGAVQHLTQQYNVPPEKINIGIAFYGRSLKTAGAAGLHVSSRRATDSHTFPEDAGSPMFYNILARQSLFNYHWDSLAQAPYLKGKSLNTFVSFDDERSVAQKARYILENGLAGAIIWDITGDFVESRTSAGKVEANPLATALTDALCKKEKVKIIETVAHLPQRMIFIKRRIYAPRLLLDEAVFSTEKKKKKEKKRKGGQAEVKYFDGGWQP